MRRGDEGVTGGGVSGFRHAVLVTPFTSRFSRHAVFLLCLLPLVRLVWLGFSGGLGANPIEFVTRSLGTWALTFLLVTLTITPLRRLTGQGHWLRFRRMLGLYAFFYATLHLLSYLWLDQYFAWREILVDIYKRPFITAGMTAFLLLLPLAATSTDRAVRRLKRNWQRLHRLVYPAALAAVLHYFWLVKQDITQPLLYALVLALLLGSRLYYRYRARAA
jgi:methionine sulfoxide reductase heme-binding subunit